MKGIIKELRSYNRNVKKNIFRSLTRVREEYLLDSRKKEGKEKQEEGGDEQKRRRKKRGE